MNISSTVSPRISVVVTTYNRAPLLKRTLLSLAEQSLQDQDYEIIIIDDGSTDSTRDLVESMGQLVKAKYVYQPNSGLASAKNHGLFHSRAPIVLFLDDDDVADRCLLEQHLAAHKIYPDQNIAVLGHTNLADDLRDDPLMRFITHEGGHLFSYHHLPTQPFLDYSYFWGGRTSCKRLYLLRHGVFNPVFKFGYEDIELGFRLKSHGLQVVYWPRAINTMIRSVSLERFLKRCFRQGESAYRFLSLYPAEPQLGSALSLSSAREEWSLLKDNHSAVVKAAYQLDDMVRQLQPNQLQTAAYYKNILYYTYCRAFRAEVIRGFVEAEAADTESNNLNPRAIAL